MIYESSNHPVEVKKIKIRVWALRDEIICTIKERLKLVGNDSSQLNLDDLRTEYKDLIKLPPSVLLEKGIIEDEGTIKEGDELDDSEDEMARALAEAEAGNSEESEEESSEETTEAQTADGDGEQDDAAAAMAAEMLAGQGGDAESTNADNNVLSITRIKPTLPRELIAEGILLLSDINMNMISCFSKKQFLHGQSIVIEFLIPNHFYASAEVLECLEFNRKSRIISEQRAPYRLHAKFTFSRPGEKTLLRRFLKSIEPEIPVEAPKKARGDGDELEDLEDLGL